MDQSSANTSNAKSQLNYSFSELVQRFTLGLLRRLLSTRRDGEARGVQVARAVMAFWSLPVSPRIGLSNVFGRVASAQVALGP